MTTTEAVFAVATLGGFLWALRFLLPRALKDGDALALTSALLTALAALLAWLLIGVGVLSR